MKKLMFVVVLLLGSLSLANAYVTGSAPFCAIDNYGNAQCFYYTYSSCLQTVQNSGGMWVACGTNR